MGAPTDIAETPDERAAREALERDLEGMLEENADGTIVVRLKCPIDVGGKTISRITVGTIRAKHIRASESTGGSHRAICDLVASPKEALEELEAEIDDLAVLYATGKQLGKYRAAGRGSSR
jgi:hypothetical protein